MTATVALAALAPASIAFAASTNGNKLQCFQGMGDGFGSNGTCVLTESGATIDTTDGDANPNNAYGGVYIQNSNLDGKLLSEVNKLAFSYTGTGTAGGSPRISLPIDEDGDGTTEAYAFIDVLACNDGSSTTGTLDAINDPTCSVSYAGQADSPNWAAFVAANPAYRVASDALAFVIVDQPGDFTITNVQLGKGPARPAK